MQWLCLKGQTYAERFYIWEERQGMAPRVGFEPTTRRLTVACSTTELPRNMPVLPVES
jgi:hypothetical protein